MTRLKRFVILMLCAAMLLPGCARGEMKRYSASFLGVFDTVTAVVGVSEDMEVFRATAQRISDELTVYHRLYDIYHTYDGMNNLCTVNQMAGVEPVQVDRRIIDLLLFCREMSQATGGLVDVTWGSVLCLWHDARTYSINDPENAYLPDLAALEEAAQHTGFDKIIIDEEASTVYITDPMTRLDVGAVAKGYAVEQVARTLPEGMMLSVGGNVRVTGHNLLTGEAWTAGVQDPEGTDSDYLHVVKLDGVSIVTSGDYRRYFTVDGTRYGHIIDPDTLYPGTLWRAVCILVPDSGVADALSTALYLLPRQEGQQLLERFGAEAMWMAPDGEAFYSPGFEKYIK
ncbi:MAG: FAD:protein FMN transferase [Clostridiales bacterium]|nr:FAD:protein FMN transferase [Clostridiales bacterium]